MTLTAYHIGYDEKTKAECPKGFKLLEHNNDHPHFREIIPILMEVKSRDWKPNEFVGFFSPRFFEKTGCDFNDIEKSYQKYQNNKDVILFSSFLGATYYWLNPWEQGEWHNPGVGKISNIIARELGTIDNLTSVAVPVDKFVFSHFLIATKPFWDKWAELTEAYLEMCAKNKTLAEFTTDYKGSKLSVHPFIVERFPSLLLLEQNLSAIQDEGQIHRWMQLGSITKTLVRMNMCKKNFQQIDGEQFKNEYWRLRIVNSLNPGDCFTETSQRYLSNKTIFANHTTILVS